MGEGEGRLTHVYVDSMWSSVYLTLGDLTVKFSTSIFAQKTTVEEKEEEALVLDSGDVLVFQREDVSVDVYVREENGADDEDRAAATKIVLMHRTYSRG